jgi:hypothetical protein
MITLRASKIFDNTTPLRSVAQETPEERAAPFSIEEQALWPIWVAQELFAGAQPLRGQALEILDEAFKKSRTKTPRFNWD